MNDRLLELITGVVQELNQTTDQKIPTENLLDAPLYGEGAELDSMHLVNFLVLVEEAIEDELDVQISLTSEKAVSRRVSPFGSVSRLIDFIEEELELVQGAGPRPDMAAEPAGQGG
jgi:acyl carrier protein